MTTKTKKKSAPKNGPNATKRNSDGSQSWVSESVKKDAVNMTISDFVDKYSKRAGTKAEAREVARMYTKIGVEEKTRSTLSRSKGAVADSKTTLKRSRGKISPTKSKAGKKK